MRRRAWLLLAAFAALLWLVVASAHAAAIYKCVGAHHPVTFQDTPCGAQARQTKLDARGLPMIDPDAPRPAAAPRASRSGMHHRSRRTRTARPRREEAVSWECRAADGEVFYRHTRCPGSVRGDGVVRVGYETARNRARAGRRSTAWDRVPVRGRKLPRAEACRRIHSAGAAVRDGHRRDAHVATYDHLMGRDPCADS